MPNSREVETVFTWAGKEINRSHSLCGFCSKHHRDHRWSGQEESDEPFRERIGLSPKRFGCRTVQGIEYWALTAHQDIVDVAVYSPTPGQVNICPLLKGGQLPGQEVLDAVNTICSADNKRPLTDYVYVHVPTQVNYSINVTYYIRRDDASLAASIQAAVQDAVSNYKTWQKENLAEI